MIFFVKENKVEDCCIEEQHSRHGNKKVRLDNSSLFTVLRVIGLIKTTLVIFYICFMGYIICKTIVSVSHVSFCLLITAYHIPLLKYLLTVKINPSYHSLKKQGLIIRFIGIHMILDMCMLTDLLIFPYVF